MLAAKSSQGLSHAVPRLPLQLATRNEDVSRGYKTPTVEARRYPTVVLWRRSQHALRTATLRPCLG
jgi:hypothetical protein